MPGTLNTPLSADEFATLMKPFAPFGPKIAVAVSGGPDSMALAYCVRRWGQSEPIGLIVEHGLRPESPVEAQAVKTRLENLGIPAEILPWVHETLHARVEEKARQARYDLLIKACQRHGVSDLLIAHHSGDQAETILMRLAKGSGVDGLAGVAPQTVRSGVRLVRPFLSLPKERLIATCAAAGIEAVTDPTNSLDTFARGRLRKIMPLLAAEGLTVESLVALGLRAREAKEALDQAAQTFLLANAKAAPEGTAILSRDALCRAPRAVSLRALAAGLRYVHDDDYGPEHASLSSILNDLVDSPAEAIRTLYGCIISSSENRVVLLREPSAATEVLSLSAGASVLWDSRWVVTAEDGSLSGTIHALGSPTHETLDRLAPGLRHRIPQGRVRATLPALFEGETLRAIPSFDEKAPLRIRYAKQGFA